MVLHGGRNDLSTMTKHLRTVSCLRHRAAHHCGDLDQFWTIWQTSADLSNHLVLTVFGKCITCSHRFWKVHNHGALSIPRKTLGLRPNNQSCHHEAWLHLDFVDWSNTWFKQDVYEQRISLKERPEDCSYGNPKRRTSEVMSDHSLSS